MLRAVPEQETVTTIEEPVSPPSSIPYPAQPNDDKLFPVPTPNRFTDDFLEAPELEKIAMELINYYGLPAGMAGDTLYLWKKKGGSSGGALTIGKCQKPSGLLSHFTQANFIIWLSADHLDSGGATWRQIRAALFHELSHIEQDSREAHSGEFVIVAHDFEGFALEATSFGFWSEGLRLAAAAVQQVQEYQQLGLSLDADEDGQASR